MESAVEVEKTPDCIQNQSRRDGPVNINVSGHQQELERNFGLVSICGLAVTAGSTWLGLGGSIVR